MLKLIFLTANRMLLPLTRRWWLMVNQEEQTQIALSRYDDCFWQ